MENGTKKTNRELVARDSNMELLRIVAMLMVLILHAAALDIPFPDTEAVSCRPIHSFAHYYIMTLSAVCVNVFVMISGWYGIRPRLMRFASLYFQVIFISIAMIVICTLAGIAPLPDLKEWFQVFIIKRSDCYWFVRAYLILYIFAPVLNAFVEKATRRQFKVFLIAFFTLQALYGFAKSDVWYNDGYSPLPFIGLYMLARYMRLYPNRWTTLLRRADLAIYLLFSAISACFALCICLFTQYLGIKACAYTSPLTLVASIFLFLYFSKLKLKSRFVNYVAASAFAVLLTHGEQSFFHTCYTNKVVQWYDSCSTSQFLLYTTLWILTVFAVSILLDKVRILVWNAVKRKI